MISVQTSTRPVTFETLPEAYYRVSVKSYQQMITAGIFGEEDAVELLEGRIVNKMPKDRQHVIVTNLIVHAFNQLLGQTHHVEAQEPITLSTSEPEPDILVLRGQILDYPKHPQGQDVALVVEVANTSLQRDQTWKKQIYAEAGIPVYWIVNLLDRQIEVYSHPTGASFHPNYRQLRTYTEGESVPVVLDGQEVGVLAIQSLLP
jgi:Uma2 family endonuclease